MSKKSLYLFLTALLGVLLFFIVHRVVVFIFLYLFINAYVSSSLDYFQFLALDYSSLVVFLIFGVWYGLWLGLYWYKKVYEENVHGGLVHNLSTKFFSKQPAENISEKMMQAEHRLEADLWELENLAQASAASAEFEPLKPKRKFARKKPVMKSKKLKIRNTKVKL